MLNSRYGYPIILARFISDRMYNPNTNKVKSGAFKLGRDNKTISTYQIQNLTLEQIIPYSNGISADGKSPSAYFEFNYIESKIEYEFDEVVIKEVVVERERHCNIIGYLGKKFEDMDQGELESFRQRMVKIHNDNNVKIVKIV